MQLYYLFLPYFTEHLLSLSIYFPYNMHPFCITRQI
jgi:hypothetical protein